MRCTYCGCDVDRSEKERLGSTVVYVCDFPECQREFERDARDAEREMDDEARYRAEADGYERYR